MFVFDEVVYAKEMIEVGFKKAEYMQNIELMILAKYLFSIGKDEYQVKESLVHFCSKYRKHFNTYIFEEILNNIVKKASKSSIRSNKEIHITKNEIKSILDVTEKLNDRKITFTKVAFVMLFLSKVYSDGVIKANRFEIFKMANVRVSEARKLEIFQELTCGELIDYKLPKGRDKSSGYIVTFSEKVNKGDYIFKDVKDLDKKIIKIINEFRKGEREIFCVNCGAEIVKINNKTKYCNECFKERRILQNRKKALKYYHKMKNFTK